MLVKKMVHESHGKIASVKKHDQTKQIQSHQNRIRKKTSPNYHQIQGHTCSKRRGFSLWRRGTQSLPPRSPQ